MGKISCLKVVVLILCFLCTSALIHGTNEYQAKKKTESLNHALADLPGWDSVGAIPLDAKIVGSLELDDYFYQYFTNGKDNVSLYVGYYLSSKKVGASHSPLVCFPGQGWMLQGSEVRTAKVGNEEINLMRVEASTPQRKELVIFWFQTFENTSSSEFVQKLYTLKSKILNSREDNAFVRITVPIGKLSRDEAYAVGIDFIQAFYPRFLNQVQAGIS